MYKRGLAEGLKKLIRRGELRTAYDHEKGAGGTMHGDKNPLTPTVGGKPRGLTALSVKAKHKLKDSLRRAGVKSSIHNPTIRGYGTGSKSDLAQFRKGSVGHQTRGKKKVKGAKHTRFENPDHQYRSKSGAIQGKVRRTYSGEAAPIYNPQAARRAKEDTAEKNRPKMGSFKKFRQKTAKR